MTTHYEAQGNWIESRPYSTTGRWDINYSSILSQLIKSCGEYCDMYASNLFIDWKRVEEDLNRGEPIDTTYIFAIRDIGVDNKLYYDIRMENPDLYHYNYHEVWELKVKGDVEEREITMELNLIAN